MQPVNIFLDSQDHVKIGDFGLATSIVVDSFGASDAVDGIHLIVDQSSEMPSSSGQLTGQIGTALYVAPELKPNRELQVR